MKKDYAEKVRAAVLKDSKEMQYEDIHLPRVLRKLIREALTKYVKHEIEAYGWETSPEFERFTFNRIVDELVEP